eukprot:3331172-Alexandrium_andersonii.AAC.1
MSASLVGSEMCIRDSPRRGAVHWRGRGPSEQHRRVDHHACCPVPQCCSCLLYTSDAADDM